MRKTYGLHLIFIFTFLSVNLLGQDCGLVTIDYSKISEHGDAIFLKDLLSTSETDNIRCQLQNISSNYFSQFEYKRAILYGQALEKNYGNDPSIDSNLILKNWELLCNAYHEMGLPDSVLVYGKKLLFALDRRISENPKALSRILEIVAMSYIDKLQYDLALEWVDLIGYHLLQAGMQDSQLFAEMLYVKGVVKTMQYENDAALGLMDSIQNWYRENPLTDGKTLARAHTLSIRLHLFLGNQSRLDYHVSKAQQLLNQQSPIDTATYISFLLNKSYYHLFAGEVEEEQKVSDEALALSERFKGVPVLRAKVLLFQGMNYMDSNELKLAAKNGEEGIKHLNAELFEPYSFMELKRNMIEFLLIQLFNQQVRDSTLDLTNKLWSYSKSSIDNLKTKIYFGNENLSDLKFSEEDLIAFGEKILFLWDYYQGKNQIIPFEIIFDFFENYKSFIFNHYTSRDNIFFDNSNDIPILKKENTLRNEILNLKAKLLIRKKNESICYNATLQILKKRVDYKILIDSIQNNFSHFFDEIKSLNSVSFKEIQKIAHAKDETFISYIVYRNFLYSMVISANGNYFNRVAIDSTNYLKHAISKLDDFHISPEAKNYKNYVSVNHNLYKLLIEPLESRITQNVVIIPHASLFDIPFGALISNTPKDITNFSSYEWLIHKYNFSYSPSIGSYILNRKKSDKTSNPNVLAVAPKFNSSKSGSLIRNDLSKLIYNIEEVKSIEQNIKTTVLLEERSTEENIIKYFKESNIIHFATHTITGQNSDKTTNLVLSTGIKDSFELVEVNEIFPKNNSTNLVVLSACNSGRGKTIQGEGKMTLANNFFRNGASVVISNLWDASDYSMKEIFDSFYQKLDEGKSISNSLRVAQINFLNTMPNELKHPFYWAGLTATGNSDIIFKKRNSNTLVLLILFLILGALGLLYKLKN